MFLRLLVLALGVVTAVAAEHTWIGKISDSMCGANHKKGAEHSSTKMSDRECTLGCIKDNGKFVFVYKGKVYNFENQDFADLTEHAGHTVRLKGDLQGDTIKVSSIVMPGS